MSTLTFQATLGGSTNIVGPNISTTNTFTLPTADGSNGQVLTTNGSGTLSFSGVSLTTGVSGLLPVANGGTGVSTVPTNGQIPIGNGTNYVAATLTAGSGISITNSSGAITIATSGAGGLTLIATIVPTNGTSSVALTSISSYKSLIVMSNQVTLSLAAYLKLAVSSDNGSSYFGDFGFTETTTTPLGYAQIFKTDLTSSNKTGFSVGTGNTAGQNITGTTGIINAIRISPSVGSFNGGGSIYVYGMN
jgi:hypothetical protein